MAIKVTIDDNTNTAAVIDAELQAFNQFARERLGEPLARPEAAIVKTYIAWKLGMDKEKNEHG